MLDLLVFWIVLEAIGRHRYRKYATETLPTVQCCPVRLHDEYSSISISTYGFAANSPFSVAQCYEAKTEASSVKILSENMFPEV